MSEIDSLRGEPLSAVAFVQDYVEFHFDGRILRALTHPSITTTDGTHTFPNPGSRDALCSLIGRIVKNVSVSDEDLIEVTFEGDAVVRVPLSERERSGPEAAHFVPGLDLPIQVW